MKDEKNIRNKIIKTQGFYFNFESSVSNALYSNSMVYSGIVKEKILSLSRNPKEFLSPKKIEVSYKASDVVKEMKREENLEKETDKDTKNIQMYLYIAYQSQIKEYSQQTGSPLLANYFKALAEIVEKKDMHERTFYNRKPFVEKQELENLENLEEINLEETNKEDIKRLLDTFFMLPFTVRSEDFLDKILDFLYKQD